MKGLLLKDWYVLLKQGRIMLVCIALYAVLAAGGNEGMGFFAVLFVAMLPFWVIGIDERNKWDNLAAAMPYEKKEIVLSRYILVGSGLIVLIALYLIASLAKGLLMPQAEASFHWQYIISIIAIGLIYAAINLPVIFRLGVEKARLWFIIITGGIAGGLGVYYSSHSEGSSKVTHFLSTNLWFVMVLAILLFLLSGAISVRLYEKREF
ncbi:ABC-2 transporter permease [Anaerocolumna xylanovorans]|uniref:ABC-2 family transporter protein n=1 Tax=Anaerocolumna xylanovorans DSM 12503 TaxID=1121345 RepID=A0A1M7XX03_9FIRM|nr:ABC-2 transporter permease [Anaerocolumna xylanovorans]SHO43383.1 ABC-2 family transporter protein [Anaerocolumna xylanovorans DSM 12503]